MLFTVAAGWGERCLGPGVLIADGWSACHSMMEVGERERDEREN